MKHLNFLSSLGSQSMGLRSVTLASTVGSPSVHRRSTMLKLISVLVLIFTFGVGQMWGDTYTLGWGTASGTTGTYSNFTAISGSVTNIVSFSSDKNSSSNTPAYNSSSSELRLYYASNGSGGSVTLTPATGVTITGFVMTTSTSPSVKYSVNGGSATSVSVNNNTYTVTGISASTSLKIQNVNTTNTQLRIKTIAITYTVASSKTLSSIAVKTAPTKVKYVAGENFDPSGLKITATYSDASKEDISYAAATFTLSPTTSTALTTSNTSVSITYGGKSTSQAINVYNVTMQARDEDGNAIPAGGPGAPSRSSKSISPAADAGNYVFKQWQVTNASLGSGETTKSNTITNPTGAVTVTAVYYKPIPVSWNKNGSLYATTYTGYNQKPVFPSNPSSCDATSNTFYGWATGTWDDPIDNLGGKTVYTSADDMPAVTAAGTTYNAVFAKATDSSTPANFTSTFTSNSWGDANSLWDSGKAGNQLTSGRGIQITTGASGANATTKSSYSNVTSVVVTYSTNASAGAGSISITVGGTGTTASGSVSTSGGTTDRTITYTPTSPATSLTGKVQITATCSTNSIYIKSVQVNYSTGGTTYSKYRTLCCTELGSINGSFFWPTFFSYLTC